MYKHLNDLLCLQSKRHKWVWDYGKIEWYCSIKIFTYEYISLLKKMVKYSLVKIITEDLVSTFFEKELKCF